MIFHTDQILTLLFIGSWCLRLSPSVKSSQFSARDSLLQERKVLCSLPMRNIWSNQTQNWKKFTKGTRTQTASCTSSMLKRTFMVEWICAQSLYLKIQAIQRSEPNSHSKVTNLWDQSIRFLDSTDTYYFTAIIWALTHSLCITIDKIISQLIY